MAKVDDLPEVIALLSEFEKLNFLLNSGHYTIKIDVQCGHYSPAREEHVELWITGQDNDLAEQGLSVVFDLVKGRMSRIEEKLRTLGISIDAESRQ
jgi:hypothetical protein